jgi:hypothetical protein
MGRYRGDTQTTVLTQTAFTAGELADVLRGRRDTEVYYLGCEKLENVVALAQGPVQQRPALRHIAELREAASNLGVRLLDITFSASQRYVIALTHLEAHVYRESDLEMVEALATPWTSAQLADVAWVSLYDVCFVVHPSHAPREIVRGPNEAWFIRTYAFETAPQHKHHADKDTQLTPSTHTVGAATMTSDGGADDDVFLEENIGEIWTYRGARFEITDVNSAQSADITIIDEFPNDGDVDSREFTQPAGSASRGWFRTIAYYQGRLWFGGTASLPFRLWGSRVNAPYDFFSGGVEAADPIELPISTGEGNPIVNLVPGSGGLEVYTEGGEGYLPAGPDQPITPTTVAFVGQTEFGSRRVRPVRLDATTLFVQRDGGAVREFIYSDIEQAYQAQPLTIRSPHLAADPVAMDVVAGGWGTQSDFLIVLNADGTGSIMTSEKVERVRAWCQFTSARKLLDVRSVGNRVFVATGNGTDKVWLEWLDRAAIFDSQKDATADPATTSWSGFDHLAGQEAELWADGYWRLPVTVASDGTFTTDEAYSVVSVGLAFTPTIRPMPPEEPGSGLLGRPVRAIRAEVQFLDSAGLRVNGQVITDRPFNDVDITPPQVQSGTRRVTLLGWSREGRVAPEITRDGPFPMQILALAVEYAVGGR